MGIMEKKMEAAIMGYIIGSYRDNGKENGNYYIIIRDQDGHQYLCAWGLRS